MTFTTSKAFDDGLYTFFAVRMACHVLLLVLNSNQVIKALPNAIKTKNYVNVRLMTFLSMSMCSICKITGTIFFFIDPPHESRTGSWFFLFHVWGVVFIYFEWTFILSFWAQVLYTYYIPAAKAKVKIFRCNSLAFALVGIYLVFEIINSALAKLQRPNWEAIGFIIYLGVFCITVIVNGFILVKMLKRQRKVTSLSDPKHYDDMIKKTTILASTLSVALVASIAHWFVFNSDFSVDTSNNTLIYNYAVSSVIEIGQMVMVMWVLSNGNIREFFTFKKVFNHLSKSNTSSPKYRDKSVRLSKINLKLSQADSSSNIEEDFNNKSMVSSGSETHSSDKKMEEEPHVALEMSGELNDGIIILNEANNNISSNRSE